jgi:benzoate membrane transport protein
MTSPPPEAIRSLAWLPAASVAFAMIIFAVSLLSVVLAAALTLDLPTRQTAAWIFALYGLPGALSLALTRWYRKPLFMAWNIPGVIFLASLSGQFEYAEMIGATMAGGVVIAAIGVLGWNERISRLIPPPIVFGVVGGTVLPFVVGPFAELGTAPLLIGSTILAYLLSQKFLDRRIPPVLVAMIAGVALALATGQFGQAPGALSLPPLAVTTPVFSLAALLTITPVLVTLFLANAYIPAVVVLRSFGFRPPERVMIMTAGTGTVIGSLLGPAPLGMGALTVALAAGPDAGVHRERHWSIYFAGTGFVLIALAAGIAAALPQLIPISLLLAVAGLALIGVLAQSLLEITRGPLRIGPLFAFVITLSGLQLLGLGAVFWALILGTLVSRFIENDIPAAPPVATSRAAEQNRRTDRSAAS